MLLGVESEEKIFFSSIPSETHSTARKHPNVVQENIQQVPRLVQCRIDVEFNAVFSAALCAGWR